MTQTPIYTLMQLQYCKMLSLFISGLVPSSTQFNYGTNKYDLQLFLLLWLNGRTNSQLCLLALIERRLQPPNCFTSYHLLEPGKSQVTTVGILPNKRSQLAHYCLVWGIRLVYSPNTISQVTIKVLYWLRPGPQCIFFSFLMFKYDVQVPN